MPDISKINALDIASVAKVDGLAKASILDIDGVTVPSAFTGLLDTYTGAAAAYSTRRLYSLYTGAALRVREDSGDTETDIGFDSNGDLDTAAIATHCGTANGYVVTWYGQESSGSTGSGNDATQSTVTSQPQIYNGTAVITVNGKPALGRQGTANVLSIGSVLGSITEATFLAVATGDAAQRNRTWHGLGGGSLCALGTNNNCWLYNGGSAIEGTGANITGQILAEYYVSTTANEIVWRNGTQSATGNAGPNAPVTSSIGGTGTTSTVASPITMQEMIVWPQDIDGDSNRTGIESNVNGYFSIY